METKESKHSRRTVRSLSVQEKVRAIDRVHEGESKASVARDLGVPESTLRGWCKGEEKLRGIMTRSTGNSPHSDDTTDKNNYLDDYQVNKKFKYDEREASPINYQIPTKESSILYSNLTRDRPNEGLPALAAMTSSINNKNMYGGYDMHKQNDVVKPLDFSVTSKLPQLPRPDMNEAVLYWLKAQREQQIQPVSPLEGRTPDASSWFWKWYKNYGLQPPAIPPENVIKLVNGKKTPPETEEENETPVNASEALIHGQKFLKWLECCSDPNITALQILQYRTLLKNVKESAERKLSPNPTRVKARRK